MISSRKSKLIFLKFFVLKKAIFNIDKNYIVLNCSSKILSILNTLIEYKWVFSLLQQLKTYW